MEGFKIGRRESLSHRLYQTLNGSVSRFSYCIFKRFPVPPRIINDLISTVVSGKSLAEVEEASEFRSVRFGGRWTDSVETQPDNEKELMEKVISSFNAARKMQANVSSPYQPSGGWRDAFNDRMRYFYESISRNDHEAVAGFLRNFFRNEGIYGLWTSETNPFRTFCSMGKSLQQKRELLIKRQYLAWKDSLPSVSLKELDAPRVGNPWGYIFDDYLLYEPVFEYNYQAHYFSKLLNDIKTPTIIEIGGGFGGLAHHLLSYHPSIKYIGFDLPENIFIQTYYLSCIFPNARILTYQEGTPPLTLKQLNDYDIVLLPNFELKRAESLIADLIINVRSLSEMSSETITEYLTQVDRLGRLFFFHENIYGRRKDELFGISSAEFSPLRNFTQISSSESRWPRYNKDSHYPCRENLFIRRLSSKQAHN